MQSRSSGVVSRWLLPPWLTLPVLFALAATTGGGCSGTGNAGLSPLSTCNASADCGSNQECSAGLCVNLVHCETAATCPLGRNCVAQICRATCSSDDQCAPLGSSCDHASGVCLPAQSMNGSAGNANASAGGSDGGNGGSSTDGGVNSLGGSTASGGSLIASASSNSGGSSGGGGLAGNGGSGGGSATPVETTDLIDDLEDGNTSIIAANGRVGQWYFYNPSGANNAGDLHQSIDPMFAGANGSQYSIQTKGGPLSNGSFAGLALDFNNAGNTPTDPSRKPYDVSAWDGISFWAKGDLPNQSVRVELATVEIAAPEQGGTCVDGACYDWYGKSIALTGEWAKYEISFADLAQGGWGAQKPLDLGSALGLNFKYETAETSFDFAIDDVALYHLGKNMPNHPGSSGAACLAPDARCF